MKGNVPLDVCPPRCDLVSTRLDLNRCQVLAGMNVVPERYLGQRDRNDKQDNEYWKEPEKPAHEKLQVCLMLFIQCEYDDEAANDNEQINRISPLLTGA